MDFSPLELAEIAAIMTLGAVLQGALGFASGLLSVPLMVAAGLSHLEATTINFVMTAPQNATGAYWLRRHLDAGELVAPTLWRTLGVPLGVVTMHALQGLDPQVVKQVVGGVILASEAALTVFAPSPRPRLPWFWMALSAFASGYLMGFAAIGGAPLVMYVNALTWSSEKSRGYIFFLSAILVPLMGALLAYNFGWQAWPPAVAALTIMPIVLGGLAIGLMIGGRIDKARYRRLSVGLLMLVSIGTILSPLLSPLLAKLR